jgi:predicted DNA-binding protein with PD1-like motif
MPHIDAVIMNDRLQHKTLRILLDEGEGYTKAIAKAMQENKITHAKVREINGPLKELFVNYFENAKFKSKKMWNQEIFRAHGDIRQSFGDLYGNIHITIKERHPISGTLVNALAGPNNEIVLSFVADQKVKEQVA